MIALLTNPTAKHGRAGAVAARAGARFAERGAKVRELTGTSAEESCELARAAIEDGAEALVVVGGDGMVNAVLPAVAGTDVPLGVIPAGTGNDLARVHGWPLRSPERAADVVLAGTVRRVDVGAITAADGAARLFGSAADDAPRLFGSAPDDATRPSGSATDDATRPSGSATDDATRPFGSAAEDATRPFGSAADDATRLFGSVLATGFDSLVSDRTNRMRWPHGRLRYDLALLAEFARLRPLPFRLEFGDGRVVERELLLVAVGNTRTYGGGMPIAPDADPSDGLLDVTVIDAVTRRRFLRCLPGFYRGTHPRLPEVEVVRTSALRIDAPGINAYADGEYLARLPVDVRVVPSAVSLFVSS